MNDDIENIPSELLPAVRATILEIIESGMVSNEAKQMLRNTLSLIERKMRKNGISLSTTVSERDMEKSQRYMGGFSGINNFQSNYNKHNKDIDGFDVATWLVGAGIVLSLISSFFNWVGQVLTDLWSKGIIQMILGAIGLGRLGYGVYILNENGSFDEIKKYFQKKKIERVRAKKEKSISKAKIHEKKVSRNTEQDEDKLYRYIKRFNATGLTIMILAYTSYHIVDNHKFNGQKISIYNVGRISDEQNYPQFEFGIRKEMFFKTKDPYGIMNKYYNDNNEFYYKLQYDYLSQLTSNNIDCVNNYIRYRKFNGEPYYYYLNDVLELFVDTHDVKVVEMFNDYQNAIVYYAANDMPDKLHEVLEYFYVDAFKYFQLEETYKLGNPFVLGSYKYEDISPLAKNIILHICANLLDIEFTNDNRIICYDKGHNRGYLIDINELRDFVIEEMNEVKNKTKKYIMI